MDKQPRVLLCEDSVEGILSAIYSAYMSRYGHKYISIQLSDQYEPELFSEYIHIETDVEKAERVAHAIRGKISCEAWRMVYMAACHKDGKKAQAIYRFVNYGFSMGAGVCGHLSDEYVNRVFMMGRAVSRELDKLKGFVRFQELDNGVLFSRILPKHFQLYFLGEHFADRLPEENWMIYDEGRALACIHRSVNGLTDRRENGRWFIVDASGLCLDESERMSEAERNFKNLWRTFFDHIEIKERNNPGLQMNMMPKRYWSHMPEMNRRL